MSMLELAEQIARCAHAGQARKDGRPYIEHVESVVAQLAGDEEAQAVAWLHDVIEDTHYTRDDLLNEGISPQVVATVAVLTQRREETYTHYIDRVRQSPIATQVKKADIVANLLDKPGNKQMIKLSKALIRLCERVGD